MAIVCPQCKKDDMIQKVSAIYSMLHEDLILRGPITLTGSSQTILSRKLAPPPKPKFRNDSLSQITSTIICLGISTIIWLIISKATDGFNCFTLYFSLLISAVFWLPIIYVMKARYDARNLPIWEKAMERWNKLYYCARDDCVFDPEAQDYVLVDRMDELLYQ